MEGWGGAGRGEGGGKVKVGVGGFGLFILGFPGREQGIYIYIKGRFGDPAHPSTIGYAGRSWRDFLGI